MKKLGYIKNKNSLIAKLQKDMKPVMKETGDIMLDNLQEQIKKDVYMNDYFPNIQYYGGDYAEYGEQPAAYPTFEFLYAWDLGINKKGDNPSIEIKFDDKVLSKKPHRSLANPSFDPRKYLAEILNVDGVTSGLQVGFKGKHSQTGEVIDTLRYVSKDRKPYWDNFIKKMTKGGIRKIVKREAKNRDIDLQ